MSTVRPKRRGAETDLAFARAFVINRLEGFEKDMKICLSGVPRADNPLRQTHAYFPALMACCATLEYLAGLSQGTVHKTLGHDKIAIYSATYMDATYDADIVGVFWEAFRHKVAHHGISSGVWADRSRNRRITWTIEEGVLAPALELVSHNGELAKDSPWPTRYTHRMKIRLGQLWRDISDSGHKYADNLGTSKNLLENFNICMRHLYPIG